MNRRRRRTVRELLELAGNPHCECTAKRFLVRNPFGLAGVWCMRCGKPLAKRLRVVDSSGREGLSDE